MEPQNTRLISAIYQDQPTVNQSRHLSQTNQILVQGHENKPNSEDNDNQQQQNSLFSMDNLCKRFVQKYQNSQGIFNPTSLAKYLTAKLRRVYDFMNIIEGCGIIKQVTKGKFKWNNETDFQLNQKYMLKRDWSSLRQISYITDKIIQNSKHGICSHQIFQLITRDIARQSAPATVRRRIYEVCNVLTLMKRFKKYGKFYYSNQVTQEQIKEFIIAKKQNQNKLNYNNKIQSEMEFLSAMPKILCIKNNIISNALKQEGEDSLMNRAERKGWDDDADDKKIYMVQVNNKQQQPISPLVGNKNNILSKAFSLNLASKFRNKQNLEQFITSLRCQFTKFTKQQIQQQQGAQKSTLISKNNSFQPQHLNQNQQRMEQQYKESPLNISINGSEDIDNNSIGQQMDQKPPVVETEKNILRKNIIVSNISNNIINIKQDQTNIRKDSDMFSLNMSPESSFNKLIQSKSKIQESQRENTIPQKKQNTILLI